MACRHGALYNKETAIRYLLNLKTKGKACTHPHIRTIKVFQSLILLSNQSCNLILLGGQDLKECNFTKNPSYVAQKTTADEYLVVSHK